MSYCSYSNSLKQGEQEVHKIYHDNHYGFPIASDDELFCRLILEINQAGLSWTTILNKQENFRKAYHNFSIKKVAGYKQKDIDRLLNDASIIRNRLKVNAAIENAKTILALQKEYGSFKKWIDSHHPKTKMEWTLLFKKTFRFTGGEIVNEFLMSTGYLPGAHDANCPVHKKVLKTIVIIGPESTGKSSLCEQLSAHFKTQWVREYAREYLLQHGTQYSFDDLLTIAKGQLQLEDAAIAQLSTTNHQTATVFIDTDMNVMKVWCEFVFEKCHHWILNQIVERKYDLYLFCNIDAPWVKDELREYPDLKTRTQLYHHYKDILVNQNTPWVDISGSYEERIQKAIAAVNAVI